MALEGRLAGAASTLDISVAGLYPKQIVGKAQEGRARLCRSCTTVNLCFRLLLVGCRLHVREGFRAL